MILFSREEQVVFHFLTLSLGSLHLPTTSSEEMQQMFRQLRNKKEDPFLVLMLFCNYVQRKEDKLGFLVPLAWQS